jgi:hypothetical protein
LQIEMERSFLIDESQQWTWHKSWNLPNISITLDVRLNLILYLQLKDPESGETLLPPPNLFVNIKIIIT